MVAGIRDCFVGNMYTLKCGVVVTVIDYVNNLRVTVQDEQGRTRVVQASQLRSGEVGWFEHGPKHIEVGDKFMLNCRVSVSVVSITGAGVLVEDSVGNRKIIKQAGHLSRGTIGWGEFGVPKNHAGTIPIMVGTKILLPCGTEVTVTKYSDCDNVLIQDSSGNMRVVSSSSLRRLQVSWKMFSLTPQTLLSPVKDRYYVYIVEYDDNIVYIGKGINSRYKHTFTGQSNSKYLNMLHFAGETVNVYIYKDDLDNETAIGIERKLIRENQPIGNVASKGSISYRLGDTFISRFTQPSLAV